MGKTFNLDEEVIIGMENSESKKKKSNSNSKTKNKKLNKGTKNKSKAKVNNKSKTNSANERNVKSGKVDVIEKEQLQTTKKPVKKKKQLTQKQQIKRRIIYRILKIIIILLILLTAILFTMFSPLFNIKEIKVLGNNKIPTDTIISLSGIQVGQNIYKINDEKVKENIKQNEKGAYINNIEIGRNLPSTIEIKIEERVVTFMLEYGNGYVYLNNQGYMLEISQEKTQVPIIQGAQVSDEQIKEGNRLPKEDLQKMEMILKIVDATKQVGISDLLTRVDISDDTDYKIMFETEQKVVHLGDGSNIVNKMKFVQEIIEDEKNVPGEIFVNVNLNERYPYFRSQV